VTALANMAAATRPPGIGDARVPCPLCGGLIHPVAGRCKHCKEDLTTFRAGRPQAAAPLPALYAGQPGQPGSHVVTSVAPVVAADAQPILPQRPTGRSMAAPQPRSLLRNWPMLVIVVAVLAIVGAVVVMVMPTDSEQRGAPRKLMPAPAPDRMDTNPVPQHQGQLAPGADPWQTSPDPSAGRQPRHAPSPPAFSVPDPDDLDDLSSSFDDLGSFGGLGGLGGGGLARGGMQGTFMMTLLHQGCQKLLSCPNTSVTLGPLCSQFSALPRPPVPRNCPSAQRCLDQIQRIDCDAGLDSPLQALALFDDCSRAATEC
jgi:hypothetical protein